MTAARVGRRRSTETAAIVEAFAAQRACVVMDYASHAEGNAALVEAGAKAGGEVVPVEADVTTRAGLQRLCDAAVERTGRLDVWVNNAGVETRHPLLETTEDDFDTVLAVDLKAAFFGTQVAAARFVDQNSGGVVVNVEGFLNLFGEGELCGEVHGRVETPHRRETIRVREVGA